MKDKILKIDDLDIFVFDNVNYRMTANGKFLKSCMHENGTICSKYVCPTGGQKFCLKHMLENDPGVTHLVINEIDIYVIDDINYKLTSQGQRQKTCMYGNGTVCSSTVCRDDGDDATLCGRHKTALTKHVPEKKEIKIGDIDILVIDGRNYRIGTQDFPKPSCMYGDGTKCSTYATKETDYKFCLKHILGDDYKEQVIKNIVINGFDIKVMDGKNYRQDSNSLWKMSCMYKNGTVCSTFVKSIEVGGGQYCLSHHNNTDPNSKERKEKREETQMGTTKTGDDNEKFVLKLLKQIKKEHDDIDVVKRVGQDGGNADLLIKFTYEKFYRAIQVKTMAKIIGPKDYYAFNAEYKGNMLMIGINKEQTRFVVMPRDQILTKNASFGFGRANTKNKEYMFTDLTEFKAKLYTLSKNALVLDEKGNMGITQLKEFKSLKRLKKISKQFNLKFKLHESRASPIDCWINKKRIQCKYSNRIGSENTYKVGILKHDRKTLIPYEDGDFDFLICELGQYKKHFYIIPIQILVEKGYIRTKKQSGKCELLLHVHNSTKPHWTKDYIDRFDLLC